jgi:LytR cell envelope-related transcriptional attenuator
MDHSLPPIQTPWRTATVVLGGVAAFQFILVIVLLVALLAEPVSQHVTKVAQQKVLAPAAKPKPTPVATRRAAPAAPGLSRADTTVIVLNGNGRTGAAATMAERVRGKGYAIGSVGNAPSADYPRNLVIYRSGFAAEGKRIAKDLGIKVVGPLDGMKRSQLLGAHVAVIIGG